MKVLITGGAGFIGSHTVDLLIKHNHQVIIVDNLSHGKAENINKHAKFYQIDITSPQLESVIENEKPQIIMHLAAKTNVENSIKNPIQDAQNNIIGTLNLLEAARKNNVSKIIYSSSAAVYGEPKYLPIDEKHPTDMLSGYGASKHTVEHYLKIYKELYNLDYTVLRYANVYGPRQDTSGEGGVISIFFDKFKNDITPIIYGTGNQIRDFIYVEDVANSNLMCLDSDICGIYNVSTDTEITINALIQILNKVFNKNIIPTYENARKGDIKDSYLSYDKLHKKLKWEPEFSLLDGIYRMYQDLQKEQKYGTYEKK